MPVPPIGWSALIACAILATESPLGAAEGPGTQKPGVYSWDDGDYVYTVRYDPNKFEAEKVRNTFDLAFRDQVRRPNLPMLITPNYNKVPPTLAGIKAECEAVDARNKAVRYLSLPGVEELLAHHMRENASSCAHVKAQLSGIQGDTAAMRADPRGAGCLGFLDGLDDPARLDAVWRRTVRASCARNLNVAGCEDRAKKDGARPDGTLWKRYHVAAFGWNNCAVRGPKPAGDGYEKVRSALRARLERVFGVTKVASDHDPD